MESLLAMLCVFAAGCYFINYKYKQSSYYKVTKQPYIRVRWDLGLYGEYMTYKCLKHFEKEGAKFLFNCYLPKKNGGTTEIDLLMIDESGIYVFESKNYSGWIFGNEHSGMWTQALPQGRGRKAKKEPFFNPILQNKLHMQSLADVLDKEYPAHSIIVFSERCQFKELKINRATAEVIHRSETKRTVDNIKCGNRQALSSVDINSVYQALYAYTQVSGQAKQEHINAIQRQGAGGENSQAGDAESAGGVLSGQQGGVAPPAKPDAEKGAAAAGERPDMACPKCGAILVLRMAKKGANQGKEFYGCSNYPKCRYIRNISEEREQG